MLATNKARYWFYKVLSFVVYAIPLLVLFAVQKGNYIKSAGTSLSFFGYIIIFFLLIAFKDKVLDFAKKNIILSVSLVVFIISIVMRYLADELTWISGISLVGAVASMVIEPVSEVYKKRADKDVETGTYDLLSHKNAWRLAYGRLPI